MTAVFWLIFLASLTLFFNGVLRDKHDPNHGLSQLGSEGRVVLERNRAGHYLAPGQINGQPVQFLLDTGATDVSVPEKVAQRLGLQRGRKGYAMTANGMIEVFQTELDSIQLGGITLRHIRASINPYMKDEVILLGMSFMKHLDMTQRSGTLTLEVPAIPK